MRKKSKGFFKELLEMLLSMETCEPHETESSEYEEVDDELSRNEKNYFPNLLIMCNII